MTNDELRALAEAALTHVCAPRCIDEWKKCSYRQFGAEITEERVIALLDENAALSQHVEVLAETLIDMQDAGRTWGER